LFATSFSFFTIGETQRKTLDMALKVKSMYAPMKHEVGGKDGAPIQIVSAMPEPETPNE